LYDLLYYYALLNSSKSSYVLILHVPSFSFVGPKVLLNTFCVELCLHKGQNSCLYPSSLSCPLTARFQ
jgi:hypothetical protein